MDEIREALLSPLWWFTALVVGIAASVIAAYVKAFIDRRLQNRSAVRHEKATKRTRARQRRIAAMRESDRDLLAGIRKELSEHIWSVGVFTFGILIWVQLDEAWPIVTLAGRLLTLIMILLGLRSFVRAMQYSEEVSESLRKEDTTGRERTV